MNFELCPTLADPQIPSEMGFARKFSYRLEGGGRDPVTTERLNGGEDGAAQRSRHLILRIQGDIAG